MKELLKFQVFWWLMDVLTLENLLELHLLLLVFMLVEKIGKIIKVVSYHAPMMLKLIMLYCW